MSCHVLSCHVLSSLSLSISVSLSLYTYCIFMHIHTLIHRLQLFSHRSVWSTILNKLQSRRGLMPGTILFRACLCTRKLFLFCSVLVSGDILEASGVQHGGVGRMACYLNMFASRSSSVLVVCFLPDSFFDIERARYQTSGQDSDSFRQHYYLIYLGGDYQWLDLLFLYSALIAS